MFKVTVTFNEVWDAQSITKERFLQGVQYRNDEKFHYQLSKEPANISLLME